MNQVTINGFEYSIGKLDARTQLHVARRLAPALAHLVGAFRTSPDGVESDDGILTLATGPLAETFAQMSDSDVDFIINSCLSVCQRKQEKGWAKVMVNGTLMFADIEIDALLSLTSAVVMESLGRFFPTSQPKSDQTA